MKFRCRQATVDALLAVANMLNLCFLQNSENIHVTASHSKHYKTARVGIFTGYYLYLLETRNQLFDGAVCTRCYIPDESISGWSIAGDSFSC